MLFQPMLVDDRYGPLDADAAMFLRRFAEPKDALILAVGDNEEYTADVLTDNGWSVHGVDLRDWHQPIPCNHPRLKMDFFEYADRCQSASFDCIYSLSALEHFGMAAYGEQPHWHADIAACEQIRRLLKPDGTFYLTVPFGQAHLDLFPAWRVYSWLSAQTRLVQRLQVEEKLFFTSGSCVIGGKFRDANQPVTQEEAGQYSGDPPHCTIFLKLRKA